MSSFLGAIILMSGFYLQPEYSSDPVDYADPLIGTWGGTGGVIPGISYPFGMTHFTPMTRYPKISNTPYHYEDTSYIIGFRGTHQPTVWMGDYGYCSLMPGMGDIKVTLDKKKLRYSHKKEISKVYYYSCDLSDEKGRVIKAEITAGSKCGVMRFTYPKTEKSFFTVEAVNTGYPNVTVRREKNGKEDFELTASDNFSGFAKLLPESQEIIGYNNDVQSHTISPDLKNFKGFFVMKFSKAFKTWGTWKDSTMAENQKQEQGKHVGAWFTFATEEQEQVVVTIGTSFISIEQARKNLAQEIGVNTFETVKSNCRKEWNKVLSKIKIETDDEVQKKLFYTFMFHVQQFPREITENEQHYSPAFDKTTAGKFYTDFSLWDTYRAAHPLLIYLQPKRVNDMIKSMLEIYDGTGRLPTWPNPMETNIMIGSHADAAIVDAYVKGIRDYDVDKAYKAIRKSATVVPPNDENNPWGDRDPWTTYEGRGGLGSYLNKGYVAADKTKESAARTLEYGYDDFCIAQMSKLLGKNEDYGKFIRQSKNYKNVYDSTFGYFLSRNSDGSFVKDTLEGFTEGNHWTYAFWVPQDVSGLIELMGGKEKFIRKLDKNYEVNKYSQHGNEQVHHYPYLYNYCGQPWRTQERVRGTIETYQAQPWGIGNEDCGQMSAWYIFSTMGFYPVTPGTDVFAIGAPQVKKATIQLTSFHKNQTFTVLAPNQSKANMYIQSAKLNGVALNSPFIRHKDIVTGGTLEFVMGPNPNKEWGK